MAGPMELPEGVWLDGPTALELASALTIAFRAVRVNGTTPSPRLLSAHRTFLAVGERWAEQERETFRRAHAGISPGPDSVRVPPVGTIGSREAAKIMSTSARAVTARANRGTLPGRQVAGVWTFELADVIEPRIWG